MNRYLLSVGFLSFFLSNHLFSQEITTCFGAEGHTYFHHDKLMSEEQSGWQKDKQPGLTTLKKLGWRYLSYQHKELVDGRREGTTSQFWPKEWFTVKNGPDTEYYDNGEIAEEKYYVEGKLDGEVMTFYESGTLCSVIRYIDGREHGPWVGFHENGVEQFRGHYINKEPCGLWEEFDEEGRRVASNFYGNGSLV